MTCHISDHPYYSLLSPQQQLAGLFPPGGHTVDSSGSQMFPSMSVNVSMNMNIGVTPGYHLQDESFAPQVVPDGKPECYVVLSLRVTFAE